LLVETSSRYPVASFTICQLAIKLLRVGTIAAADPLIPGSAAFSPEEGENIDAGETAI
jgi:hypothetical protein